MRGGDGAAPRPRGGTDAARRIHAMGTYQFPGGPALDPDAAARLLSAVPGDRRAFFRRAAALGLAAPMLGGLVSAARPGGDARG